VAVHGYDLRVEIGAILPGAQVAGAGTHGWVSVRSFAVAAEERGVDSVWMFDHFFNERVDGQREGMLEAWTIVSAVAAVTHRIKIGTLVLCSPFRHPGLVAKMATTADEISAGRLILGVGAGWHDPEFTAFGYPSDHRVTRFAEALPIMAGLLRGDTVTARGRYHDLRAATLDPPPRRQVPLLVAAEGPRMLRLTARYADAWNTAWYGPPDDRLRAQFAAMDRALAAEDRDRGTLTRTVGVELHDPDRGTPADPTDPAITGSVTNIAKIFDAYQSLGVDHLIVQLLPHDERSLDRLAAVIAARNSGGNTAGRDEEFLL
jgi:FMNH2-dependent dimethyl sulfone monooxygenase